jgi:Restriction endonuclease S subunits
MAWPRVSLSSVAETFADGDWIESKDQSEDGIRLIQTGNVGIGEFKDRSEKARYVSAETFHRLRCNEIFAGDCLVSRLPDPVGRACLLPALDERLITAVDCTIIRFKRDRMLPEFFVYYSQSAEYLAAVEFECTGTTRKRISRSALGAIQAPCPPLSEQKRIVCILNEAFEGIRIATANAEKNLANAPELFERRVSAALSARGPHWHQMPLSEACVVERGSSPRPIKQFLTTRADGVNWVKIGDTRGGGKYVSATKEKITPKGAERSRKVEPGDFILTNSMSFGRPYIMATSGFVHDGWFVLRLKPNIDPDFFYFLLSSRLVQDQFRRLATGAVVQNISSDLVKQAILLLPPIDEQRRIAELLQRAADERDQMRARYDAKIGTCEALKQSILARAFSGQLTATKGLAA